MLPWERSSESFTLKLIRTSQILHVRKNNPIQQSMLYLILAIEQLCRKGSWIRVQVSLCALGEGRSAAHCQALMKAWSAGKDKWFFPCIQLRYLEHSIQFAVFWWSDNDILDGIQGRAFKIGRKNWCMRRGCKGEICLHWDEIKKWLSYCYLQQKEDVIS